MTEIISISNNLRLAGSKLAARIPSLPLIQSTKCSMGLLHAVVKLPTLTLFEQIPNLAPRIKNVMAVLDHKLWDLTRLPNYINNRDLCAGIFEKSLSFWSPEQTAKMHFVVNYIGREIFPSLLRNALQPTEEGRPWQELRSAYGHWLLNSSVVSLDIDILSPEYLELLKERLKPLSPEDSKKWAASIDADRLLYRLNSFASAGQYDRLAAGLSVAAFLLSILDPSSWSDTPAALPENFALLKKEINGSSLIAAAYISMTDAQKNMISDFAGLTLLKNAFLKDPGSLSEAAYEYFIGISDDRQDLSFALISLLCRFAPEKVALLFAPGRPWAKRSALIKAALDSAEKNSYLFKRGNTEGLPVDLTDLSHLVYPDLAPELAFGIWGGFHHKLEYGQYETEDIPAEFLLNLTRFALSERCGLDVGSALSILSHFIVSAYRPIQANECPLMAKDLGQEHTYSDHEVTQRDLSGSELMVTQVQLLLQDRSTMDHLVQSLQQALKKAEASERDHLTFHDENWCVFPYSEIETFFNLLYNISEHLGDFRQFDDLVVKLGPEVMNVGHMFNRFLKHQMGHSTHIDPRINCSIAYKNGFDYLTEAGYRVWSLTHPGIAPPYPFMSGGIIQRPKATKIPVVFNPETLPPRLNTTDN